MHVISLLGASVSSFIAGATIQMYVAYAASEPYEPKQPEPAVYTVNLDFQPFIATITLEDIISDKDKKCLIENVYFESRGEPIVGQEAVVWVVLNRMLSGNYSDDVCEVIYQPKQFSWTSKRSTTDEIMQSEEWRTAEMVVEDVLQNYFTSLDPTSGSMFFHSTRVQPSWADDMEKVVRINNHIFYKEPT